MNKINNSRGRKFHNTIKYDYVFVYPWRKKLFKNFEYYGEKL